MLHGYTEEVVTPPSRRVPALLLAIGLIPLSYITSRADQPNETRYETQSLKDVAYYNGPDADPIRHKLDLFLPKGKRDFPVFFFVHGGAWVHGDKNFMGVYGALGTFLAHHGIGTVVINYRLSPTVRHPEHIRDVARAFAWTHKNIANYGGRPDCIFVSGHSAGGHLASLLATDPDWLKAEGLNTDAIRGVISLSGVYDLTVLPEKTSSNFMASIFGPGLLVLTTASPQHHAREGLPPFLIMYADKDLPGCDHGQASAFAKALRDKKTQIEEHEIAGSNHYKIILSASVAGDPVSKAILNFIAAHGE